MIGFHRAGRASAMTGGYRCRWRFPRIVSAIFIVITMGTVAVMSGASAANAKCRTGRANDGNYYWDGWDRGSGQGVYSQIYNYSPWVSTSNGVVAWTMVDIGENQQHWAQVGWLESTGGVRYTFVEWTNSGYYYTKLFNPQPVGSFSYYTTLWNNTPGKFTFQVNSSTIDKENADFTPDDSQISGEIKSLIDQMPGARQNNENFDDSHVYIGGWQNFNGSTFNTNTTYFGNYRVDSNDDDIWDNACQY
jgi:hypothetical protein